MSYIWEGERISELASQLGVPEGTDQYMLLLFVEQLVEIHLHEAIKDLMDQKLIRAEDWREVWNVAHSGEAYEWLAGIIKDTNIFKGQFDKSNKVMEEIYLDQLESFPYAVIMRAELEKKLPQKNNDNKRSKI